MKPNNQPLHQNPFPLKPLAAVLMVSTLAMGSLSWAEDEKKEAVRPEPVIKIDPQLKDLAQQSESLPVIIIFGEQPQRQIARDMHRKYNPRIDKLAGQVRNIYERYLPKESLESQDEEIEHSKLLEQYVSESDKKAIKELNREREQLMQRMRKEIAEYSSEVIASSQEDMVRNIEAMGGKVGERLGVLNAVSAKIPAHSLEEIANMKGVAEVVYDHPGKAELNNQASSLGANTWWSSGFDGGIWDVGVLDEGVLETHAALSGHTFYENYAPNGNHGTGVACMYASTNSTYRGLAYGLDSVLVDNAGSTGTSMAGADWMVRFAGDDPEVINYSWGNGAATGSDWHAFSRFVDAIVYDYSTSWAKSAGNNGFGTNTMTVPANNYNGLTVANMNDFNTVTRTDDVITSSSSRGPTVLNRKKPDLAAPGNNTMTCNNAGGYSNLGGTSSAAPKVGAGTLLLTDGGNWDPKAIKAVLINTADSWEDNNTQTTADDGAKIGREWNKTYGWGYLDLWHAHFHRTDYFLGSVKPNGQSGDFKLYKGPVFNGDKATLVWERDVDYNNAATPTTYRDLSDIDLRMYNESTNAIIGSDTSIRDNVHQVAATGSVASVVKVYAYSSSFDGASSEPFALATEENFTAASGPAFSTALIKPSSVPSLGTFTLTARIRNTGDLDAHAVKAKLNLPAGFTLLSGAMTQSVGKISDGGVTNVVWQVRAPFSWWFSTTYPLSVNVSSNSYNEAWAGVGVGTILVN